VGCRLGPRGAGVRAAMREYVKCRRQEQALAFVPYMLGDVWQLHADCNAEANCHTYSAKDTAPSPVTGAQHAAADTQRSHTLL